MDSMEEALRCVARAEDWSNRDNVDAEFRPRMVDYNLRLAEIYAQVAIAERLDTFLDIVFSEKRAITVDLYRPVASYGVKP